MGLRHLDRREAADHLGLERYTGPAGRLMAGLRQDLGHIATVLPLPPIRHCRIGRPAKPEASTGFHVIGFYTGEDVPVLLLNVFAKGDRVDLSQAERNVTRKELAGLAEDDRQGARSNVQSG